MEQIILTAAAVVEAFIGAEADAAIRKEFGKAAKESATNAVATFKALVMQEQAGKPDFMLPTTWATVISNIEAGFAENGMAIPGAFRTAKSLMGKYIREGFTDLTIGRDAMKKAADAAEQQRINGAEKARQELVDAYNAEQEAMRIAKLEEEAATAAAEKEAAATAELARVAVLWRNLQDACQSKAAQAAFAELATALSVSL